MFISKLEFNLLKRSSIRLYNDNKSDIISIDDINEGFNQLESSFTKYETCIALETIYYCFSILLSEVRQHKREVLSIIFKENNNKIADEKKALEKKLDSYPEYADLHNKEECLFQFLEHITNIKNYINWLVESADDE